MIDDLILSLRKNAARHRETFPNGSHNETLYSKWADEVEALKASLQVSNIELAIYKEAIERMPLESIKAFIASMASVRDELEAAQKTPSQSKPESGTP